jgi:hypothetical protein
MNGPMDIPSLDALVADPGKAAMLSPHVARALVYGLAGLLPALLAVSTKETGTAESAPASERWLTVEETAEQFGVSRQWLYRHKHHLPHSQPSRKVLVFPEGKLRKWFTAHKTS